VSSVCRQGRMSNLKTETKLDCQASGGKFTEKGGHLGVCFCQL
jgi:hypothetical protein